MVSVSHIIGGVVDYCRHPSERILPRGLIAERFIDRWAYYVNQLSLTGETWQLQKTTVHVSENRSVYAVNAVSFGKPVVVYVLDDQQNIAGELEIVRFRDQVDGVFTNLPPGYSLPASAVPASKNGIAFYSEDGQQKARIVTTPISAGALVIYYMPSGNSFESLQDSLSLLDNFANLFKIHTALICMPDCEWTGLNEEQNEAKRNRIEKTLAMEFALLTEQFNEYKASLFQEQTNSREGWGDAEEYGYGGFI
jgi:hypothetical protein